MGPVPKVAVVSASYGHGQVASAGVENGPSVLLATGLLGETQVLACEPVSSKLHSQQWDQTRRPLHQPFAVGRATRQVYEETLRAAVSPRVVVIGGDHSIALGSVSAMAARHGEMVVVWVDAHADINTPKTTSSGNIHGCPVSYLIGHPDSPYEGPFEWLSEAKETSRLGGRGFVDPRNLVYVGLRDVEPGEMAIIAEYKIRAFFMAEIRASAVPVCQMLSRVLGEIDPDGSKPIYVSFDIDGLDPAVAPSTGTPVAGGLSLGEGLSIVEWARETGRMVGMDLVEFNPAVGSDGDCKETVSSCIELMQAYALI